MELIIDGYNLIRQSAVFKRAEAESLEAGRDILVAYLEAYRKIKKHKITVVFDGEKSFHLSIQREKIKGITVVYSGLGEKADDVIKRMLLHKQDVIVVSSDREIMEFAERHRATAISAQEFLPRLEMAFYCDLKGEEETVVPSTIAPVKKGPARRLSKRKRKKQKVLKKL